MTTWPMLDKACIVGIGETEYTRWGRSQHSEFQLALRAVTTAVADAGLKSKDIDGFVVYGLEHTPLQAVAQALGINRLRYGGVFPGGGNCTAGVLHLAAMAVHSGSAEVVVCYRSVCQGGTLGRYGQGSNRGINNPTISGQSAFTTPFGVMTAAHYMSLQARRHMHEFGTRSEHFGAISVACYKHAQQNPRAVMYGRPLTLEYHQSSRMISDPYRLFDCCQESDGACAVVVTTPERARTLRQKPVYIRASSVGNGRRDGMDHHSRPDETWVSGSFVEVGKELFQRAEIDPSDIAVAQIYENFSGQVLMSIEDFGFCKRGEGGPFAEGGTLEWPNGKLPLNTSGGNLAEAYIHGLELVIEGVRQMRGESKCQIPSAEFCLVTGGPSGPPSTAAILRRS